MSEKISQMPAAGALTGTELVPIVQDGDNKKTTVQDIADLGDGGGTNIYNSDGTITGNRVVDVDGKTFSIQNALQIQLNSVGAASNVYLNQDPDGSSPNWIKLEDKVDIHGHNGDVYANLLTSSDGTDKMVVINSVDKLGVRDLPGIDDVLAVGQALTTDREINTGTSKLTLNATTGLFAINLGSDSEGDIFYRDSSGNIVRLPIGNAGEVLGISGNNPAWVSPPAPAAPYLVYTALLTQSGTDAPVVTAVMQDTIGDNIAFQYAGTGQYTATKDNGFPSNKTFCLINVQGDDNVTPRVCVAYEVSNQINIIASQDENLRIMLEIRVYP